MEDGEAIELMAGKPTMPKRGEGRGGYIKMATLPNTEKWITPR